MKFRKKPIIIDAVMWRGDNLDKINKLVGVKLYVGKSDTLMIQTLEGMMMASPGYWIIKGMAGEFYPCSPDIFEATYEKVK